MGTHERIYISIRRNYVYKVVQQSGVEVVKPYIAGFRKTDRERIGERDKKKESEQEKCTPQIKWLLNYSHNLVVRQSR